MRESEYIIDNEILKKGLRPYRMAIENQPVLEELFNLRCVSGGLAPVNKIGVFREIGERWPFPKILEGSSHTILADVDSSNVLTLSHINTDLSLSNVQTISDVSPLIQNMPEMADFEEYIVIIGDFGILYGTPSTGYTHSATALDTIPLCRTCCNFHGQLILGGITSDWYDCDEEFVVWSNIGYIDCTLDDRNEAGYTPVRDAGKVWKVRPLGNQVIVYGEKKVMALTPAADPAPTFGKIRIGDVGLATREAIDGNHLQHVYVGYDHRVYRVSSEGVKPLGYKSFIDRLNYNDIKVRFNPIEQEFYISDGEACFVLTNHGMSESSQIIGESVLINREIYGVLDDSFDSDDYLIMTGPLDFQQRGMKTLMMVESDIDDAFVTVWIKNKGGDFRGIKTIKMNEWNNATIMLTGQEFKIELAGSGYSNIYPSYIKARFKMVDFRSIRGKYND